MHSEQQLKYGVSYNNQYNSNHNNHFWSYNIGLVHLISFSTEFYFYYHKYGTAQIYRQYNWLVEDLKHANNPEQRAQHPWIITMGHRPFYGELPDVDQQDNIVSCCFCIY